MRLFWFCERKNKRQPKLDQLERGQSQAEYKTTCCSVKWSAIKYPVKWQTQLFSSTGYAMVYQANLNALLPVTKKRQFQTTLHLLTVSLIGL